MIHISAAPVHHPGWILRGPGLRFVWLQGTLICSLKSLLGNHIPFRAHQITKMQHKHGFYFFVNIGWRKALLRNSAPGGPLSNLVGVNNNHKTSNQANKGEIHRDSFLTKFAGILRIWWGSSSDSDILTEWGQSQFCHCYQLNFLRRPSNAGVAISWKLPPHAQTLWLTLKSTWAMKECFLLRRSRLP